MGGVLCGSHTNRSPQGGSENRQTESGSLGSCLKPAVMGEPTAFIQGRGGGGIGAGGGGQAAPRGRGLGDGGGDDAPRIHGGTRRPGLWGVGSLTALEGMGSFAVPGGRGSVQGMGSATASGIWGHPPPPNTGMGSPTAPGIQDMGSPIASWDLGSGATHSPRDPSHSLSLECGIWGHPLPPRIWDTGSPTAGCHPHGSIPTCAGDTAAVVKLWVPLSVGATCGGGITAWGGSSRAKMSMGASATSRMDGARAADGSKSRGEGGHCMPSPTTSRSYGAAWQGGHQEGS